MTPDFAEFAQIVLIFYATNAALFFLLFRPGTKGFEMIMSMPGADTRPAAILVLMFHVTLPVILAAFLTPKVWRIWRLQLQLGALRLLGRLRLALSLRQFPPEARAAIRRDVVAKVGKDFHRIKIGRATPEQIAQIQKEIAQQKKAEAHDDA